MTKIVLIIKREITMKFEKLAEVREFTPALFQEGGLLAPLLKFPGTVLAGGAIRDTYLCNVPKDYDIFFTVDAIGDVDDPFSEGSLEFAEKYLKSVGFVQTATTHYTKTYSLKRVSDPLGPPMPVDSIEVQLIFRDYYASREDIINRFDFTTVMFAIDDKGFSMGEDTIYDLDDRVVNVQNIEVPLDSLNRLKKYAMLGFDVDEAYEKVVKKLSKMTSSQAYGINTDGNGIFYGN
jgi:hypothetical protein